MTRNIVIKKAEVEAIGGDCCAGIGGGYGVPVDGIYISDGAKVIARGGKAAPGIGSGGISGSPEPLVADAMDAKNIVISGGNTEIIAYGASVDVDIDGVVKTVSAPAIGCGLDIRSTAQKQSDATASIAQNTGWPVYTDANGNQYNVYSRTLTNVTAQAVPTDISDPNTGTTEHIYYFGNVQMGTSESNIVKTGLNFVEGYDIGTDLNTLNDSGVAVQYVHVYYTESNTIDVEKVPNTAGLEAPYNEGLAYADMSGATFALYTDAAGTRPYEMGGGPVTMTTGTDGKASQPVPNGTYYARETAAPTGFQLDNSTVFKVVLSDSGCIWTLPSGTVLSNNQVFNVPYVYNVTFKDHDGATLKAQRVPYGLDAIAPGDPAWAGHSFTGWDKPYEMITGDLTVNALYEGDTYTVTFVIDGIEVQKTEEEYGANVTPPVPAPPAGSSFSGWSSDAYKNVTEDMTISGSYAKSKIDVRWLDEDGTVLKTEQVEYGADATPPSNPSSSGKVFSRWDADYMNITGANNATSNTYDIKAVYATSTYSATFSVDGATVDIQQVEHGKSPAAPAYTVPDGKVFLGWYASQAQADAATVENPGTTADITAAVTGNVDYFAKTVSKAYTVVFKDADGHGGTVLSTQVVRHGDSAVAPGAPSWDGHTFSGWNKVFSNVTSDLVVSATYDTVLYTVRFVIDGVLARTEKVEKGRAATAPMDTRTAIGYYFAGWDKAYSNIQGDLVVNGHNEKIQYMVTFLDADGNTLKTQMVEYGGNATAPAAPVRAGETFVGWSYPYNNITYNVWTQAVYSDITHTVEFLLDDETVKIQNVGHGGAATAPDVKVPAGKVFSGWDKAFDNVTGDLFVRGYLVDAKPHTVTFVDDDGKTVIDVQQVPHNGNASLPTAPVHEGSAFSGWDGDHTEVTEDRTIVATYKYSRYSVVFKNWDGSVLSSQMVDYGHDATAPADPSRSGYAFSGWDKSYANVTSDIVVNALFNADKVRIYYSVRTGDEKGGRLEFDTRRVDKGSAITDVNIPGMSLSDGWVVSHYTIGTDTFDKAALSAFKPASTTYVTVALMPDTLGNGADGSINVPDGIDDREQCVVSYLLRDGDEGDLSISARVISKGAAIGAANVADVALPDGWFLLGYFDGEDAEIGKGDIAATVLEANAEFTVKTYPDILGNSEDDPSSPDNGTDEPDGIDDRLQHVVCFYGSDGEPVNMQVVDHGKPAIAPELEEEPDGMRFVGWDKVFDRVTQNMDIAPRYADKLVQTAPDYVPDYVPRATMGKLVPADAETVYVGGDPDGGSGSGSGGNSAARITSTGDLVLPGGLATIAVALGGIGIGYSIRRMSRRK